MFQLRFTSVVEPHICWTWCNYVVRALMLLAKNGGMHSHDGLLIALGSLKFNYTIQCAVLFVHRGDDSLHVPGDLTWLAAWNRCGVYTCIC